MGLFLQWDITEYSFIHPTIGTFPLLKWHIDTVGRWKDRIGSKERPCLKKLSNLTTFSYFVTGMLITRQQYHSQLQPRVVKSYAFYFDKLPALCFIKYLTSGYTVLKVLPRNELHFSHCNTYVCSTILFVVLIWFLMLSLLFFQKGQKVEALFWNNS